MKSLLAGCTAALFCALAAAAPPALAQHACDSRTLAERLHQRLQTDGRSNAEILDILGSGFKRGVLRGRVEDSSGCSAEEVEEALVELQAIASE